MTDVVTDVATDQLWTLLPAFARAWFAIALPLVLWAVFPRFAALSMATALAAAAAWLRGPLPPDTVTPLALVSDATTGLALGLAAAVPLVALRAVGVWLGAAASWPRMSLWLDLTALALWSAADGPGALLRGIVDSYAVAPSTSVLASAVAMLAVAVEMAFPLLFAISAMWIALAVGQRAIGPSAGVSPWLRPTVVLVTSVGLAHVAVVFRLWLAGDA